MAYQVSFSGTGATGSVTYNYPTGGEALYGGPTFSQRTESPSSTFSYTQDFGTEVITRPDNSTLRLTPTSWEIKDSAWASVGKIVYTYVNDPGGSQQVQSITTYDDIGIPTKVDFDYDQYGNIVNSREYGFKISGVWQVRRRTHNTYRHEFGQQYADAYIRDRVTKVEVFDAFQNTNDGDDVLIAKTEFKIDEYSALGGIEGYSGAPAPPSYLTSYDTNYVLRGNVTGSTEWTDIASNASVTRNSKLDKFGNLIKAEVSCCNQKSFTYGENTYWSKAEQVVTGDPAGINVSSSMSYNFNNGTMASETGPNGQSTSFIYDSSGRPSAYTLPTGANGGANYNIWGLTSSSSFSYTDGGANKTLVQSAIYDGWGQVIQTIDTNGAQVNISYDALGRVQSRTNPFPQGGTPAPARSYQYDVLGRLKITTLPDGNTIQYNYSGSSVTIIDQVNRKTKREGDGLGRLVSVVEQDLTGALAQETNYTYDIADRLIQVNQGGQLRSFKYDSSGRLLFEKIPEQTATINDGTGTFWTCKYTYTDFGAVATRTDARGVVTTYGYDSLNRLTSVSYDLTNAPNVGSTNNIAYAYDNSPTSSTKGLLLSSSMTGPLPTYQETFSYDSQKRVSSRTWTRDGRSYTIGYQYNTANQLTQLTYPSGRVVATGRDNKGRVTSVSSFLTSVSYNGIGQVTGLNLGNGVSETYGYDSQRLQLTSQTATKSGNTLMSLSYNFQALAGQMGPGTTAGNASQLISISGTIDGVTESASYTYDLLRRITTSSQTTNGVSAQRRFAYDRWGNRTGVWDAVTGGNQIQSVALQQSGGAPTNRITSVTSSATVNYSYDSAGNVTSDGSHTYSSDGENRLYSVDSGATGSYRCDYQNRRVKKTTGAVATHYVWEGSRVIAEYDQSTGTLLAEYVYRGNHILAKIEGSATRYYLGDRLSTRLVVDSTGNMIGRQNHLPFGEEIGVASDQEKHHFTSYERDGETGNDYAINRINGSSVGRFLSADPYRPSGYLIESQSWNRYSYTQNDPINNTDPLGLRVHPLFDGIIPDQNPGKNCVLRGVFGGPTDLGPPRFECDDIPTVGHHESSAAGSISLPIDISANYRERLAAAWLALPDGCKSFFGGNQTVSDRATEFRQGDIIFVTVGGPGFNDPIRNAPPRPDGQPWTFALVWRAVPAGRRNHVFGLTIDFKQTTPQDHKSILLGPAFLSATPERQNATLVHESLHLLNNLDDVNLVRDFISKDALGLDPNPDNASTSLTNWILKGCPRKSQ